MMSHLNVRRETVTVLVTLFLLFFSAIPTLVVATDGIVNTKKTPLNIRSQPSTKSAIIAKVKKGSRVRILDDSGSRWYIVRLSNGKVGYARSTYIRLENPLSGLDLKSPPEELEGFKRYSQVKRISTPKGFLVQKYLTRDAGATIAIKKEASVSVIGHLEEDGSRFYLTEYSYERYQNGYEPNWIYVPK